MTLRKLSIIAFCVFICTLAFSGLGYAVSEETQTVYDVNYGGLHLTIVAPVEANPGENITISVATSASDVQQIYVNYIELTFYGVVNDTTKVTLEQISHLKNVSLTSHNIEYTISVPDNISPGLTFGEICCDWKALSASFEVPSSGFTLTYIKNVALDQLQTEYTELNATYNSLVQNYTDLEAEYNELSSNVNETDSAHSLMYVFIVTTVICVITIIVLLMRKPKNVWV